MRLVSLVPPDPPVRAAGDYVYQNRRLGYTQAGMWGLLRVLATAQPNLQPLGP